MHNDDISERLRLDAILYALSPRVTLCYSVIDDRASMPSCGKHITVERYKGQWRPETPSCGRWSRLKKMTRTRDRRKP